LKETAACSFLSFSCKQAKAVFCDCCFLFCTLGLKTLYLAVLTLVARLEGEADCKPCCGTGVFTLSSLLSVWSHTAACASLRLLHKCISVDPLALV
jgi:hypothetical protein